MDAPGTEKASPSEDMKDLIAALNDVAGGPAASKASGTAPSPTQTCVIPANDDSGVAANLQYLRDMASMISLYTVIYDLNAQKQRGATKPNSITDPAQAAQAFADTANAAYVAMTGPLAGFYNITSSTSTNYSKHMRKSEIHLEFLGEIFKGFQLGTAALTQLDGILTNFVSSLADVKISSSSEATSIDQTLLIHQIQKTNVSGDDKQPLWAYVPKTRLVYMKVDSRTWAWATSNWAGKTTSDEGFDFNIHYVVVDADINVAKVLDSKPKLDLIFQKLTDKNLEAFGIDVTGKSVKTDA